MIASKLFSNCRNLAQKNALGFRKSVVPVRGAHVVAIPPRNRMPASEFAALSGVLAFACLCVPCWVLYHLPDYQKEDRNQYTGK